MKVLVIGNFGLDCGKPSTYLEYYSGVGDRLEGQPGLRNHPRSLVVTVECVTGVWVAYGVMPAGRCLFCLHHQYELKWNLIL